MKSILFFFALAFSVSSCGAVGDYDSCQSIADDLNRLFPRKIDNITFLQKISCVPTKPKIRFVYYHEVRGMPLDVLKAINYDDLKPDSLNYWCTDPNGKMMFLFYDVEYKYYTERRVFLGSFLLKFKECGNR